MNSLRSEVIKQPRGTGRFSLVAVLYVENDMPSESNSSEHRSYIRHWSFRVRWS